MQAFQIQAKILKVDSNLEIFTAVLNENLCEIYNSKDYGRLIFDTSEEAEKAARRLPKPGKTIYQIIGKKVYKKTVTGIKSQYLEGTLDLVICLNRGKDVPIKEIGNSVFFSREDSQTK